MVSWRFWLPVLALAAQAQALQGDSWCGRYMCVNGFVNGSDWTYQMESNLGENGFGWMAVGFGSSMSDSKMVIMWPNHDGSVTLSQRTATGHSQPKQDQNPPRTANVYLPLSSQSQSQTSLSFTISPNGELQQHLVWALGTTRPPSSAKDAELIQHISSGGFALDLSKEFSGASEIGPIPTSPPGGTSYRPPSATHGPNTQNDLPAFQLPALLPYQKMLMAHAALCSIGFLIILPIGVLIARWGRVHSSSWFKAHWMFQAGLGIPIIGGGWALSIAGVHKKEGSHFDDAHKLTGLVLFGAYTLQLMLGLHIHLFKPKSSVTPRAIPLSAVSGAKGQSSFWQLLSTSNRPFANYLHPLFGILIIGGAFWNVYRGLSHEWEKSTGRGEAPIEVTRLLLAWMAIVPLAYLAGLYLLPKQLRQERKTAQSKSRGSDALPLKTSPPASKKSFRGLKISSPIPINEEEEWKREETVEGGYPDAMSEDSHAAHSMTPVRHANAF